MAKSTDYPVQFESRVALHDGTEVLIRPVRPDDARSCYNLLSRVGKYSYFIRFGPSLAGITMDDAIRYCTVDYRNTFGLVAEVTKDGNKEIVAIGRYYKLPHRDSADLFIMVDIPYQHKGLATNILQRLASIAQDNGINTFEADVLADSKPALSLINNIGFYITAVKEENIYHVVMPLAIKPTKKLIAREQEKERTSTVESIKAILYPRSIAIIGASRIPGTVGYSLVRCLIQSGFTGAIYPVNPNAEVVQSIKAYPTVLAIPGDVDLAIIAVPAKLVPRVTEECGQKGVKSLIVISDGFRESGPEGAALERELRDIALSYGMRVVGPNCMGVINTDPDVRMNATFSTIYPSHGNISFLSQSGAMGIFVLDYARSLDTGINTFFSVGNRVDVSVNDLLQYWEQDPKTKVILLYLESFGNPKKFVRIARRVSTKKPVVVVKSGKTAAGSKAASSHTGAMATSEVVVQALFRQTGVIRVSAIEELFDVANFLSNQPLPRGRRLVIVTNGGGPGILAADAAAEKGLVLPEISVEVAEKIKRHLRPGLPVNNPLDTTAGVKAEDFAAIMQCLAADKGNDMVLAMFVPPVMAEEKGVLPALQKVVPAFRRYKKPLIFCYLGQKGFQVKIGKPGNYVPSYAFPENAISALAKVVEYAERRAKPKGVIPKFAGIQHERAREIVDKVLLRSIQRPLWLTSEEIADLLECYGIRFARPKFARTASDAVAIASGMGFPVAVKLASTTILHKTDVGGVVLNVESPAEVEKAFNEIKDRLVQIGRENEMDGVTVQPMISEGIETIVGVSLDPSFGPLIMFGMGGVNAELINDVAFSLHPLTDLDAKELISSIKMARLFEGHRGSPPSDVSSIQELLLRLSAMVEDLPQITELDFNPVKVLEQGKGYWVVDARIAVS